MSQKNPKKNIRDINIFLSFDGSQFKFITQTILFRGTAQEKTIVEEMYNMYVVYV